MRSNYSLLALLVIILFIGGGIAGCQGGSGPIYTGSPDPDAGIIPTGGFLDGFAAVRTTAASYGLALVSEGGEVILSQTTYDAFGNLTGIAGAYHKGPGLTGTPFIVRFDIYGWPKHAVYGGYVFFFRSWSSSSVDVAVIYPDSSEQVAWNLPWNPDGKYTQAAMTRRPFRPLVVSEFMEPLSSDEGVHQLNPYGRSMQTYGYSVLPRTFDDDFNWREAMQWSLTGVNFAKAALGPFDIQPEAPWLLEGEIAFGGVPALDNPHMMLIDMNLGWLIKEGTPAYFAAQTTGKADLLNASSAARWEEVIEVYEVFQQEFYDYEFYGYTYW